MILKFIQRLFNGFALLALAGLLVFGGGVRYLCDCNGSAVLTQHEHCHGEHGEEGPVHHVYHAHHAHHAPAGHRHDHHGEHEEDEHDDHHHELVKVSIDFRVPELVSAPEMKLIPLLWTALGEWETAWHPKSDEERPRPPIAEDPPSLSHQVARSVVRLI